MIQPANLIDDMSMGTPDILMQGGRSGSWSTANDGTPGGMQTPAPGSPCIPDVIPGAFCGFGHAQHTFGSGFGMWGAGIGFDLASGKPYNAGAFTGITFFARGTPTTVRFEVTESATVSTSNGGTCGVAEVCNDFHSTSFPLSASWAPQVIPFSSLMQASWGTPAAFDKSTIISVSFLVQGGQAFDLWITDIGFY
jgi:hypothetical protein